jgi:hypothetical protein
LGTQGGKFVKEDNVEDQLFSDRKEIIDERYDDDSY